MSLALGFASGVLLATIGFEMLPQALELATGSGQPLRVSARALPLEAANVAVTSVPATAVANRPLAQPIVATVSDAYGNPIPDVQVVFGVSAGSAAPLRVMTNAKGQASTKWTPGAKAGEQTLTATVRGTTVRTAAAVEVRAPKK